MIAGIEIANYERMMESM